MLPFKDVGTPGQLETQTLRDQDVQRPSHSDIGDVGTPECWKTRLLEILKDLGMGGTGNNKILQNQD